MHRVVVGERPRQLGRARRRRTSGGCWSSSTSLSDDLRDELAQIAPARRCCCLAELSALFHASGAWHLRGGTVAVHLDLVELGDRAARVRAPARPRRAVGDPHLLAPLVRPRDEVPAARRRRRARARRAARGRRALRVRRAARAAAETRRRAFVLPRRLPARSDARRGVAVRPARPASRTARRAGSTEHVSSPTSRRARTSRSSVAERRAHAVAYAKGHEAIADVLALAGAGDTALRLEEHAVLAALRARREPARERRRGEPRPRALEPRIEQVEAINAVGLDALPEHLVEIAELRLRHPSASLRELAAKARPPITKAAAQRRSAGDHRDWSQTEVGLICNCSSEANVRSPILRRWRVRARPTVDTDPVHRHRSIPGNRREGSSSELSLRPASRAADARLI